MKKDRIGFTDFVTENAKLTEPIIAKNEHILLLLLYQQLDYQIHFSDFLMNY
ncbi:MAG: hypothetical protein K0S67_1373 [Nitrososphaeraceae archaeon]|jgi:hypothetical protein|nr:hypothetical protein [Nitrososphaeraceae archaeon]MCD6037485.1 hypothetical protein [Nitrososphaeraceae archaeon]MDF2767210.1 hypothetical protein [Nitrososphaeraceae archaeon]